MKAQFIAGLKTGPTKNRAAAKGQRAFSITRGGEARSCMRTGNKIVIPSAKPAR